mgnify:CR=1 FL=1
MSDKIFIDTNLLVYSISTDYSKAAIVEEELRKPHNFIVSTQIVLIAAALENECTTLLSEDLQHGQIIDGRLTILNPFMS